MIEINIRNKEIYILTSSISGKLFMQYKYFDMITRFIQSIIIRKNVQFVYEDILTLKASNNRNEKKIEIYTSVCFYLR